MLRRRVAPPVVAVAVLVVSVIASSCGGDDGPELRSVDPPDEIVAYAIAKLGPHEAVLPIEQGRELAIAAMATTGIPRTEAECVLTEGTRILGGDEVVAKMTIDDLADFGRQADKKAEQADKAILAACVSAESLARQKETQLAPDFDPVAARDLAVHVAVANAVAVGLTPEEAECYADRGFASRTDEEVSAAAKGESSGDARPSVDAVNECLSEERIDELAPELEQALLDEQARQAKAEQEFRDRVDEELKATTSVPG